MIKRIEFLDANVIVLEQTEAAASAILCQQMQQLLICFLPFLKVKSTLDTFHVNILKSQESRMK